MIALGIDTSNYATSMAVVDTGRMEVVCAKKVFLQVPKGQCGLRQSDAVFQHTKTLPLLFNEVKEAGALSQVETIGVSVRPRPVEGSYMPCFLAGLNAATAAAALSGLPVCQTSHQQGHLAAALFAAGLLPEALNKYCLMLHFSGGTTEILHANGCQNLRLLGKSLDLYAGQAVDRLGVRLGFDFPAGPALSKLALSCEETPMPKTSMQGANCHLSGLQNQCEALLEQGKEPSYVAKFCLLAIARTALQMVAAARKTCGNMPVLCAGGVFGSEVIRREMEQKETQLYFVPAEFSSDNAVGVACLAGMEGQNGSDFGSFGAE